MNTRDTPAPLDGLACLVLAHDNAPQLRLLLDTLVHAGAECHVHLDARAAQTRTALAANMPPGVRLLPQDESVSVAWGGYGMIEASLLLLRSALSDERTQHLCLLSGTHLPVQPAHRIADFLFDGRQHMDLRLAAAEPPDRESLRRFWYGGLAGREESSPAVRLVNRYSWTLGKRNLARDLRGLTPHVGSQWWHMTAGCARACLEFLYANPWFESFFRKARIPDESFFQTLVASTDFYEQVGEPCSWQVMRGYSPGVVRVADLQAARDSGRPFARKFNLEQEEEAVRLAVSNAPLPEAAGRSNGLPDGLAPIGAPPAIADGDIVALMVTRNEALRLPSALRHLRALGVDRVLLVDNRSTDGTREIAAQDERVDLVDAPGSYAGSNYGVDWTNALLDRYARGHWVLVVDADELLVFPGSDRPGALRALCRHLDAIGSEALPTILLDCFPAEPLRDLRFRSGEDLPAAAPWFEPPALRQERSEHFPYVQQFGGLRERLFFPEADPNRPGRLVHQKLYNLFWRVPALRASERFRALAPKRSPNLTKAPLVKWREGAGLVFSTHMLRPMALAPEQPSGVLLHFKFLQDFHARAEDAVARGAHYDQSREYRRYLEALEQKPAFSLHSGRSVRYAGPEQLVELGVMRDTPEWAEARGVADALPTAGHGPDPRSPGRSSRRAS